MNKRQLFLFSLAYILILGNGVGMSTMLPVYLTRIDTDPGIIGMLFSMLYLALAVSGILGGWLSDRFQQRKLLCVLSAAGEILTSILMVSARSLTLLSIALVLAWFLAGIHMALVTTLVGLQAEKNKRGQVFGILGFVMGIGPILSGFLYGPIMDRFGMGALFGISLVISVIWTALSLFYKDVSVPKVSGSVQHLDKRPVYGMHFFLIFLVSILGWVTINGGKLGISILMTRFNFSAADISSSAGIASLAALALPLGLGWLSDRTGRKVLIIGLNFLGIAGLLILSQFQVLAGFWLASALLSLYSCFSGLISALTADLVPPQGLGLGLSLVGSTSNIAGIVSSSLLGVAFAGLGAANTFLVGLVLPLAGICLISFVGERNLVTVLEK